MIKFTIPWNVHPEKDEAWLEEQKNRMTEDELAREILISYDYSVKGVVFKEFTKNHIVSGEYNFNPFLTTIVGFDFGRTCAALMAQKTEHGHLQIFKEFVLTDAGTQDLGQFVKSYTSDLNSKSRFEYCCDPAGNSKDHRTLTTDVQILKQIFGKETIISFDKSILLKDRLKDGISLIKKKLSERIQAQESIQVWEESCPILVDSFRSGYRYKADATGHISESVVKEEHPYEDVMDCLRYIMIEKFTIAQGPPKRKKMKIIDMKFEV